MTECELRGLIKEHNESIDFFINVELAARLKAKNGQIKMSQWFEAQKLIREQNFYVKGKAIQDAARLNGFKVLMDMQSDKLVY